MELIFRPIEKWPGELTRSRKTSQFKAEYRQTIRLLDDELIHLGANRAVVQLAVKEADIRLDGSLRANVAIQHPGVILSFESKHGPLSYPCDTFFEWRANLRAIALALECLRTVDRYGVTKTGAQYRGWQQLPVEPQAVTVARDRLEKLSGMTVRTKQDLESAFRAASRRTHPDHGGTAAAFAEVVEAKNVLAGELKA